MKNPGNFFLFIYFYYKKNIDAEVMKWRTRRPETIVFFGLRDNFSDKDPVFRNSQCHRFL